MKHEGILESERYSKRLNSIDREDYMRGWGDNTLFHRSVEIFLSHIVTSKALIL